MCIVSVNTVGNKSIDEVCRVVFVRFRFFQYGIFKDIVDELWDMLFFFQEIMFFEFLLAPGKIRAAA